MAQRPLVNASEHYWVEFQDEDVLLRGETLSEPLIIGTFYGQPSEAAIDPEERWCVMVGWGLIVYRLGQPWTPYHLPGPPFERHHRYSKRENWGLPTIHESDQWWEYGRGADDRVLLDTVDYAEGERFEAGATNGEGPSRYAILAEAQIVRAVEWPSDSTS